MHERGGRGVKNFPNLCDCYKLIQRFRVTDLFAGQHNTKLHGTIRDVVYMVQLEELYTQLLDKLF